MLFGLLCLTFAISHVMPGDPARLAAGPDANESMVETLRAKYGLDRPLGVQFVRYLGGVVTGDLGQSLRSRNAVLDDLVRYFPNTFELVTLALLLAVVTLCFPALASIMRVNRAEMLETLRQDYIVTARAQGFSGFRVVTRYALRNAMIPTFTMIGLRYGWMLGGTVLIETVFDWPGIGLYAVNAAVSSDFQPIMGVTLVIGLNFMLANLLVDLAYGWLDPRIRRASVT